MTKALYGMRIKLERRTDDAEPCCSQFGIVRDEGRIRCAGCGRPRGELQKEMAEWLLNLLAHFPDAKKSVPIIRKHNPNLNPLRARDSKKVYRSNKKRKLGIRSEEEMESGEN
jgi:hypothetical protein